MRSADVVVLTRLVPAREQQDQPIAFEQVLDPVTRAVVDPQLRDADGPDVSRVACHKPVDANQDTRGSLTVTKPGEPPIERRGLHNLDHVSTVVHGLWVDNGARRRAHCRHSGASALGCPLTSGVILILPHPLGLIGPSRQLVSWVSGLQLKPRSHSPVYF